MAPRALAALFLAAWLPTVAVGQGGPAAVIQQALVTGGAPAAPAAPAAAGPAAAATPLCKALSCADVFHPGSSCQCTSKCKAFGNCCADYDQACAAVPPTTPPPATPVPATPVPATPPTTTPPPTTPGPPTTTTTLTTTTTTTSTATTSTATTTTATWTTTTTTPRPPWPTEVVANWPSVNPVVEFDIYRAMAASGLDMHPMEDDDVADLGGVLKYIVTEIIVESQGDPKRPTRKYDINAITRHRFKIRNPDALLASEHVAYGEFGQFVTYDWGKASNTDQVYILKRYGDFVGVQGCPHLHCDPRYPSSMPYSWLSLGNWCPNLPFNMKGTKQAPHPACLRDMNSTVLLGGLCPDGFNAKGVSPPVDPTGQPGCIYSYGRGQTVLLDELVGITEEDCGGEKCRNWLHFRNNCSKKEYRMKFNLVTETVVETDYCVEHDIHPRCQRNCFNPECQALIESGGIVYLGLPFWRGICDQRANIRRMERVVYALGTAGALTRHQIVDEQLTKATCRPSVGTSSPCVPVRPGQSGPFCTRYYNGLCEPCFIPGTVMGPDSVPACPLDVYEHYEGVPKPECKSKRASEGCCLYDGSCEGDDDPTTASLSDPDSYALIAGKQSTEDMATFLTRVVEQGYPEYKYLLADKEQVKYAAYSAWGRQPANQSLFHAVHEFGRNLKGLATPSRTVLSPPAELLPWQCFELAVAFAPLDMDGVIGSQETDAYACQQRCQRVAGCAHFSFMPPPGQKDGPGSCHLQDIAAAPVDDSTGFVAGPYKCWEDIDEGTQASLIDIGYQTYVTSDMACIERGISYVPRLFGTEPENITSPTRQEAIQKCRERCITVPGCERWTITFPMGLCSMHAESAAPLPGIGAVSGPRICMDKAKATYWKLYDSDSEEREPGPRVVSAGLLPHAGIGALAALVSVLLVLKYRVHQPLRQTADYRTLMGATSNRAEAAATALERAECGLESNY